MTSESLLIWEEENHKQATDEVYKDLVAAIEQLRENCTRQTLDDYRVIWATPERDYGTTTYTVTGFEEELGETKMKIRGGRGGSYEVIPKPDNEPWIRYLPPEGAESAQWEEPLDFLALLSKDVEFGKDAGGFIEYIKKNFSPVELP